MIKQSFQNLYSV